MGNDGQSVLAGIRDVDGVFGSFVLSEAGVLVAKDLPAIFDEALFEEVGPRLLRMYETLSSGIEAPDNIMMRFAEHKLYVRKIGAGFLAVLTALHVNAPALKMACTLVGRRIAPLLAQPVASNPPPASKPPPPPAAPSDGRRALVYRGQRVDR